jgi:multiple sugar transport system permease protein
MIRPFIFFAITMTIIGNLQLFEEPFVLTSGSGGTGQAGLTISMYLYKVGWEWLEMGTASAISWLLFALIAFCTMIQFFFFGKKGLGEQ